MWFSPKVAIRSLNWTSSCGTHPAGTITRYNKRIYNICIEGAHWLTDCCGAQRRQQSCSGRQHVPLLSGSSCAAGDAASPVAASVPSVSSFPANISSRLLSSSEICSTLRLVAATGTQCKYSRNCSIAPEQDWLRAPSTHRLGPWRNPCTALHSAQADTQCSAAWQWMAAAGTDAGRCDWCERSARSGTTGAHPPWRCSRPSLLHKWTKQESKKQKTKRTVWKALEKKHLQAQMHRIFQHLTRTSVSLGLPFRSHLEPFT